MLDVVREFVFHIFWKLLPNFHYFIFLDDMQINAYVSSVEQVTETDKRNNQK